MASDPQAQEPQEPDKYSLDDMMQRLRSRGSDSESKMVTRSDGTQAYRVKKRKRRSNQPHKIKQHRRQKTQIMQIGAIVVLVMLLVTGSVGLFAYYNSSGFLDKLRGQIAEWTGAEVEFTQFRVTPVNASAVTTTMRWPESGVLRELKLEEISADLKMTSFVSRRWIGEEVMARRGTLQIGEAAAAEAANGSEEADGNQAFPFSFIRYRCENLMMCFGRPDNAPVKCRDMEVSFYRLPDADQLRINKGSIAARDWPELPIQRGLIEFHDGMLTISSLSLVASAYKEGFANIEGIIDLRSGKPAVLDVTLEDFPFELIGGKKLSHLIDMRVDSKAKLSFVPGHFDSYELIAPFDEGFASKGVFIGGFPFLRILSREFQDDEFGARSFTTEAEGVLHRNAKGLSLENLRLTEKNFLALRGELHIDLANNISGHFDVGIPERLVGSHPSALFQTLFKRDEDGFRWSRIQLSGNVHAPNDDFAERIKNAADANARKTGTTTGTQSSDDNLERKFQDLIEDADGQ